MRGTERELHRPIAYPMETKYVPFGKSLQRWDRGNNGPVEIVVRGNALVGNHVGIRSKQRFESTHTQASFCDHIRRFDERSEGNLSFMEAVAVKRDIGEEIRAWKGKLTA